MQGRDFEQLRVLRLYCVHNYYNTGEGSDFEPPEVISARLEVAVSGLQARPLQIVRLQATVGVARLNVPRALQVMYT